GAFVYSPPAGTTITVGTQTLTATFTPQDTTNYTTATASVTITALASTYILDPSAAGALTLSGNAQLVVPGVILVNSSSTSAINAGGNATVAGSAVRVHGSVRTSGNAHVNPSPVTGAPSFSDPFAGLAIPGFSTSGL